MNIKDNLIFDIGLHRGEDTIHYLQMGYEVLAVEANPILVEYCSRKFKKYIDEGKLTILNVGIADKETTLPFYRNSRLSEWSSFDEALGRRANTTYDVLNIPCVTTKSLFKKYGIPHYLKVDIEGFDYFCINDIYDEGVKPTYVSCEASDINILETLKEKGYRKFKAINQLDNHNPLDIKKEKLKLYPHYQKVRNGVKLRLQKFITFKHPYGSAGPFGEKTKGKWHTYEEIKHQFMAFHQFELNEPLNGVSWFDFHATN